MDEETLPERFETCHIEEHGWFDMKSRICAERWAGFRAHAECCQVVVELPRLFRGVTPECQANNNAVELCRTAIEAAGGRVAQC